ncbi:MAG: translational GTPase TypA [Myxococcota bacterium]
MNIRNLAIIAHVDHGKTTLVDGLLRQSGVFASHREVSDRVMDSGDLERERGITITAKNAAFTWKDTLVNVVDTPGHADFGSEVERALFMVDGALLLVDAAEGPLPQTRFVLAKALQQGIRLAVVINKVDRPDARVHEVEEQVLELFYDLAGDDGQTEYDTLYASAKQGWASTDPGKPADDLSALLDLIVQDMPPPRVQPQEPFHMLVADRRYDSFMGQIAVGRIEAGQVGEGQRIQLVDEQGQATPFAVTALQRIWGLGSERVSELTAGNIALIAGAKQPRIGDVIQQLEGPAVPRRLHVDPPAVSARIAVNTSPLAGKEGTYLTSRKLYETLEAACRQNVALSLHETDSPEVFELKARGELQIVVLLEQMRRQGYELMAGRPRILVHERDGQKLEPQESLVVDVPQDFVGAVTEFLAPRGGTMQDMQPLAASGRVRLEFIIPTRGLIGMRSQMLTRTRGEAVYASSFQGFIPWDDRKTPRRQNGALVADRDGTCAEYGLFHLQDRGRLFVGAGTRVYEGMIFGEHSRDTDLNANPTKEKKLTNMRASGSDESTKLDAVRGMSLDEALEWIDDDEWVEITPKTIRLRKAMLKANQRKVTRG